MKICAGVHADMWQGQAYRVLARRVAKTHQWSRGRGACNRQRDTVKNNELLSHTDGPLGGFGPKGAMPLSKE